VSFADGQPGKRKLSLVTTPGRDLSARMKVYPGYISPTLPIPWLPEVTTSRLTPIGKFITEF
jgi:hypothetical protein